MSKSTAAEVAVLKLILQNVDWANIGDATGLRGSTVPGVFYVSLHTADPGEAGDQTTNECTYGAYARVAVVRSAAGWTVSAAGVGSNAALVTFPKATSGSETATHFAVGTDASGTGNLLFPSSAMPVPLAIATNITPEAAIGAITITED